MTAQVILKISSVLIPNLRISLHTSRNVLQLLNKAEIVFRLKMMNIHGPFNILIMKVSNQNSSIFNCHDVGAKILKSTAGSDEEVFNCRKIKFQKKSESVASKVQEDTASVTREHSFFRGRICLSKRPEVTAHLLF